MLSTRKLNLIDIFQLKKDLLWGKFYYGLFDNGKLIDSILYSKLYKNTRLYQIHNTGNKTREFMNKFISHFALRKKVRYFLCEFDELEQVQDIEFMHSCGFKRYNRNYCFEFDPKKHDLHKNTKTTVYCRAVDKQDILHLIDIDTSSQILDYRDQLYRSGSLFKENLENIIVFCDPANTNHIYGFACQKELLHKSSFDFIINSKELSLIQDCILAFAEYYIHFEKIADSFRFILNENHKELLDTISKAHNQVWTSQCLILEGAPRERNKNPNTTVAFRRAAAS